MSKTLTGLNADTIQNLQLDAGVLLLNFDPQTEDVGTVVPAKIISATRGGGTFTSIPEIRAVEVDGRRGPTVGLDLIDTWEMKLACVIIEITKETLRLALAGSTLKTATATEKYDVISISNTMVYTPSVCWAGTLSNGDAVIIELKNVVNTNGLNYTATDKGEGELSLELSASFNLTKPDEIPFNIYYPKTVTPIVVKGE